MNGLQHPLYYWQASTFIPKLGQICQVIDYPIYKVGDGVNTWNNLQAIYPGKVSIWFSKWYGIHTLSSIVTQLDKTNLFGGSFVQEGGWVDFEYVILPANNSNVKNAYVKVIATTILTVAIPINSAAGIVVRGKLKCIDFKNGILQYRVGVEGTAPTVGTIAAVNWSVDNALYLSAQGIADKDVVFGGGEGRINIIARK